MENGETRNEEQRMSREASHGMSQETPRGMLWGMPA